MRFFWIRGAVGAFFFVVRRGWVGSTGLRPGSLGSPSGGLARDDEREVRARK